MSKMYKVENEKFGNWLVTFQLNDTVDSVELSDCWNEDEAENKFYELFNGEVLSVEFLG